MAEAGRRRERRKTWPDRSDLPVTGGGDRNDRGSSTIGRPARRSAPFSVCGREQGPDHGDQGAGVGVGTGAARAVFTPARN